MEERIRGRHDGDIKGIKVTRGMCAGRLWKGRRRDTLRIKSAVEERRRISVSLM